MPMGVRANPVLSFVRGGRSSQSEHRPADHKALRRKSAVQHQRLEPAAVVYREGLSACLCPRDHRSARPRKQCALDESGQISPRFILSIKKSHERTQRVMMVRVGFWQGLEVKPEASITKRFLMSWHC